MGKRLIATIWLVGTLVMIAGGAAMLAAAPTDNTGGSLHGHPVAATAVLLVSSGVAVTGFTLQLAAWIGALINTHQLARKTWFYVLLWVGTAGLVTSPLLAGGIIWWNLMLIYLLTAPDGKLAHTPRQPKAPAPQRPPAPFTPGIDTGRRPPWPLSPARPALAVPSRRSATSPPTSATSPNSPRLAGQAEDLLEVVLLGRW